MMGLAIAHQVRDQVVFTNEPIFVNPQYNFNIEKHMQTQYDWGESVTIV